MNDPVQPGYPTGEGSDEHDIRRRFVSPHRRAQQPPTDEAAHEALVDAALEVIDQHFPEFRDILMCRAYFYVWLDDRPAIELFVPGRDDFLPLASLTPHLLLRPAPAEASTAGSLH